MVNSLGKQYQDGDLVVRQGDMGSCMYVVQHGELDVVMEREGSEVLLRRLEAGDIFGEMALFEQRPRSATVRARGEAQVLTVDKRTLLRRIQEDPLVALNLIEDLCRRIRTMSDEHTRLKSGHDTNRSRQ